MKKKVLVTSRSFGSINDEPIDILKNANCDIVKLGSGFSKQQFVDEVLDSDAIIIGAHDFDVDLMKQCENLKIICKHGAGLDNIDLKVAKELGIVVCNAPGTNSNAVADLVWGFMFLLARKINIANEWTHSGIWKTVTGVDVYKKNLGILGFGAIGKCVARRAAGFSMNVLVYDPYIEEIPDEFKAYTKLCDKEEVLKQADFLTVHMPLTEETHYMIDEYELNQMKDTSFLINTARGGIINEKSLYHSLREGEIAGAALDVTEEEPIQKDNPLLTLDNVLITPHIGMYTQEAINAVGIICANNIANYFSGKELKFRVV